MSDKVVIYDSTIEGTEDGEISVDHVSGAKITTDNDGKVVSHLPTGVTVVLEPDGIGKVFDKDGNLLHEIPPPKKQ